MIADNSAASIEAFVRANVKRGTTLCSPMATRLIPGLTDSRTIRASSARWRGHVVLPWIYRAFSLMKRWSLGTHRRPAPQANSFFATIADFTGMSRSKQSSASRRAHQATVCYWDIIGRANPRKGAPTPRRAPRRRKTATGMRQDGAPPALGAGQDQPTKPVRPLHTDEPGTTG